MGDGAKLNLWVVVKILAKTPLDYVIEESWVKSTFWSNVEAKFDEH